MDRQIGWFSIFQELESEFTEARAKRKSLITQINVRLFFAFSNVPPFIVEIISQMGAHVFYFLALGTTLPVVKSSERKVRIENSMSISWRQN